MTRSPVASGRVTSARSTIAGAGCSTAAKRVAAIGPLAVERRAERVDHAAEQGVADGNARDLAGAVDDAARGDALVAAE